jgi:hypothetical protein
MSGARPDPLLLNDETTLDYLYGPAVMPVNVRPELVSTFEENVAPPINTTLGGRAKRTGATSGTSRRVTSAAANTTSNTTASGGPNKKVTSSSRKLPKSNVGILTSLSVADTAEPEYIPPATRLSKVTETKKMVKHSDLNIQLHNNDEQIKRALLTYDQGKLERRSINKRDLTPLIQALGLSKTIRKNDLYDKIQAAQRQYLGAEDRHST